MTFPHLADLEILYFQNPVHLLRDDLFTNVNNMIRTIPKGHLGVMRQLWEVWQLGDQFLNGWQGKWLSGHLGRFRRRAGQFLSGWQAGSGSLGT